MKPPAQPDPQVTLESLPDKRERLMRALFETRQPDIEKLLSHALHLGLEQRPTDEQLLKPLQVGLKKFQIPL